MCCANLLALLLVLQFLGQCWSVCYFPSELQGEFVMQSSVTVDTGVQYTQVNITIDAISIWGHCHRRSGNSVFLLDSFSGGSCIRCFHLKLLSRNVLQVETESLDKCYTTLQAAQDTCPDHRLNIGPPAKQIILYKSKEAGGLEVRKDYCPINGKFTFIYNINDGAENKTECGIAVSEIDNCPTGSELNLRFRRCSFDNHDITFNCLGHWEGPDRQQYMALLDTRTGEDRKPQYRCAIYKEEVGTGIVYMAFSRDSTCTASLKNAMEGYETLLLTSAVPPAWPVSSLHVDCKFPGWAQGHWEHLTVEGKTLTYKDSTAYKTFTMKCVGPSASATQRFVVFGRTQCGEAMYGCIWIKKRTSNVLEFQLGMNSSMEYNDSLCHDANFIDNIWITQGKMDRLENSPCPIMGEYNGMIPDADGLCARLSSDCQSPEIMYYTVSDCLRQDIFDGAPRKPEKWNSRYKRDANSDSKKNGNFEERNEARRAPYLKQEFVSLSWPLEEPTSFSPLTTETPYHISTRNHFLSNISSTSPKTVFHQNLAFALPQSMSDFKHYAQPTVNVAHKYGSSEATTFRTTVHPSGSKPNPILADQAKSQNTWTYSSIQHPEMTYFGGPRNFNVRGRQYSQNAPKPDYYNPYADMSRSVYGLNGKTVNDNLVSQPSTQFTSTPQFSLDRSRESVHVYHPVNENARSFNDHTPVDSNYARSYESIAESNRRISVISELPPKFQERRNQEIGRSYNSFDGRSRSRNYSLTSSMIVFKPENSSLLPINGQLHSHVPNVLEPELSLKHSVSIPPMNSSYRLNENAQLMPASQLNANVQFRSDMATSQTNNQNHKVRPELSAPALAFSPPGHPLKVDATIINDYSRRDNTFDSHRRIDALSAPLHTSNHGDRGNYQHAPKLTTVDTNSGGSSKNDLDSHHTSTLNPDGPAFDYFRHSHDGGLNDSHEQNSAGDKKAMDSSRESPPNINPADRLKNLGRRTPIALPPIQIPSYALPVTVRPRAVSPVAAPQVLWSSKREERQYRCLGQWEEGGLTYTYTQRKDVGTYECFVGAILSNNELYIKEAGEHCERDIDPMKNGMKLTKKRTCTGASYEQPPTTTPRPFTLLTKQWITTKRIQPQPTKPWKAITAPPRHINNEIEDSSGVSSIQGSIMVVTALSLYLSFH